MAQVISKTYKVRKVGGKTVRFSQIQDIVGVVQFFSYEPLYLLLLRFSVISWYVLGRGNYNFEGKDICT